MFSIPLQLNPHRDWYNVRKCDTHVHHSACMNERHLLSFMKAKLALEPDDVVAVQDGCPVTLKELFERLSISAYDLSIDQLDSKVLNGGVTSGQCNMVYRHCSAR